MTVLAEAVSQPTTWPDVALVAVILAGIAGVFWALSRWF